MWNRIFKIIQMLVLLWGVAILYQFDKSHARQSKLELEVLRGLKAHTSYSVLDALQFNKLDSALRKKVAKDYPELYKKNRQARQKATAFFASRGFELQKIQAGKASYTSKETYFVTSQFLDDGALAHFKLGDFHNKTVGNALKGYRILSEPRKITLVTALDTNKIDHSKLTSLRMDQRTLGAEGDYVVRASRYEFRSCKLEGKHLIVDFEEDAPVQIQRNFLTVSVSIPVQVEYVNNVSYLNLLQGNKELKVFNQTELDLLEKYAKENLDVVEKILTQEYTVGLDRVNVFGFKLTNEMFSIVIIVVLLFMAIAMYMSLGSVENSEELSSSESIYAGVLKLFWFRIFLLIIVPACIGIIAQLHASVSMFYSGFILMMNLVIMCLMVLSFFRLNRLFKK